MQSEIMGPDSVEICDRTGGFGDVCVRKDGAFRRTGGARCEDYDAGGERRRAVS